MAEKVHRSDPLENLYVVRKRIGLPHFLALHKLLGKATCNNNVMEFSTTECGRKFQKRSKNFRLQNEENLLDSPLHSRLTDDIAS